VTSRNGPLYTASKYCLWFFSVNLIQLNLTQIFSNDLNLAVSECIRIILCTHPSNEKSENHLGVALLLALKEFIFSIGITLTQQAAIEPTILIRTNC
jgi:hypothetical protein